MNIIKDKDFNELKKLNDLSTLEAVNTKLLDKGQFQLDLGNQNLHNISSSIDDKLEIKKELLTLINEAKEKGTNPELQERINALMVKLKASSNVTLQNQSIIKTQNITLDFEQSVAESKQFAKELGIDLSNPYMSELPNIDRELYVKELTEKFDLLQLNKYDYAYSVASGGLCGMVDAFLVGTADKKNLGKLAQLSDKAAEKMVMNYAKKKGWQEKREENITLKKAIEWLEDHYPVCFDQRFSKDIKDTVIKINPNNHHLLSISHGFLGMIFGILDLLQGKSTFFDTVSGKLIRVEGFWSQDAQKNGLTQITSIREAWERWFGHLMSDLAGSSSSIKRGTGLPTGFETLTLMIQNGQGSSNDVTEIIHKMFTSGYDFRFSMATSVPVFLNQLLIRFYWMLKQRLYYKKPLKECSPLGKGRELQRLLLVSDLSFETLDFAHAIIKGKGNYIVFFCSLNYIGLCDLAIRILVNFILQEKHIHTIDNVMKKELQQKYIELIDCNIALEL